MFSWQEYSIAEVTGNQLNSAAVRTEIKINSADATDLTFWK